MATIEATDQITLTPAAIEAVQNLLTQKNLPGYALRIFISGGGCSGYQHGMSLEGNVHPEDTVYEYSGVKVVVDEVSIEYLHGTTIDYINDEHGTGFKIDNPNTLPACGCGSPCDSTENTSDYNGANCGCNN